MIMSENMAVLYGKKSPCSTVFYIIIGIRLIDEKVNAP